MTFLPHESNAEDGPLGWLAFGTLHFLVRSQKIFIAGAAREAGTFGRPGGCSLPDKKASF
jgi:hypothetical protein